MKNLPSSSSLSNSVNERPKLVCRVMRMAHSWQSDGSDPQGAVERHGNNCEACAEYFSRSAALEQTLVKAIQGEAPLEIPAGMEDRIWAAVRPEVVARGEPVKGRWFANWKPVVGGLVAAALVVAVWLGRVPGSNSEGISGSVVAVAEPLDFDEADIQELVASLGAFSTELLTASTREAEVATRRGGLEQELDALGSDARGVLHFLGQNFLPNSNRSREEV